MTNRKATTDNERWIKDTSLHGPLVAFGMISIISIVVIVFAYAASDGRLFQGIIESFPTLEGLDKQIQDSFNAFKVEVGDMQQLITKVFDFLSSSLF